MNKNTSGPHTNTAIRHLQRLIDADTAIITAAQERVRAYELSMAALSGVVAAHAAATAPKKVAAAIAVRADAHDAATRARNAALTPKSRAHVAAIRDTIHAFVAAHGPVHAHEVAAHLVAAGFVRPPGRLTVGNYFRKLKLIHRALGHGHGTTWTVPTTATPRTGRPRAARHGSEKSRRKSTTAKRLAPFGPGDVIPTGKLGYTTGTLANHGYIAKNGTGEWTRTDKPFTVDA